MSISERNLTFFKHVVYRYVVFSSHLMYCTEFVYTVNFIRQQVCAILQTNIDAAFSAADDDDDVWSKFLQIQLQFHRVNLHIEGTSSKDSELLTQIIVDGKHCVYTSNT